MQELRVRRWRRQLKRWHLGRADRVDRLFGCAPGDLGSKVLKKLPTGVAWAAGGLAEVPKCHCAPPGLSNRLR